ncbi:hypothetical protein OMP38_22575 [Cohnella ginsengisoli]|uniref:Extracellular solute-binding protein n=1 Tax=Cohnella ginsengisoli TaxID=425004 RepID=A0A9X4KJE7_9BACL|nr:hypothetical protein [Cohnella ginsengisoli]MDG0793319.1 hypothetical protein [Cohnella ginsengisoli]
MPKPSTGTSSRRRRPKAEIQGGLYLGNLASINAKSANPDDAWAFIKHLNSEEVAKFKARSQGELSVRQKFIQPKDGATYRIEAFTNVKAYTDEVSEADQELYRERPNLNLISELGSYLFQEAADGKKTIDEALAEWDRKGNELLQKIKQNPKGGSVRRAATLPGRRSIGHEKHPPGCRGRISGGA